MARLVGWEKRLAALFREAQGWTYERGVRDCAYFSCRDIHALTGEDRWPLLEGYRTRREMKERMAALGSSFDAAVDNFLGAPRIAPLSAQRGDLAMFATPDGHKHLAVVKDYRMVCLDETGLRDQPLRIALTAWRIG